MKGSSGLSESQTFILQLRASSKLQIQMSHIYSKTIEENRIAPQKKYHFTGLHKQYNLEKLYTKLMVLFLQRRPSWLQYY